MSGENRPTGDERRNDSPETRFQPGRLLPMIVVAVGVVYALTAKQNGTLSAVTLGPVNWAGLALMAVGAGLAFMKKPRMKLAGVLLCGIGAILVICL